MLKKKYIDKKKLIKKLIITMYLFEKIKFVY